MAVTNLAQCLKKYRVMKEVGLRELAQQIDISAATLSRFENGNTELDGASMLKVVNWLWSPESSSGIATQAASDKNATARL